MNSSPVQLSLRQPDDWHLHLRDDHLLKVTVPHSARIFRRAVIMPNLSPPITSIEAARNYRQRILNQVPTQLSFTPLMTAYLTDSLPPEVLEQGYSDGVFFAAKLYPANATTNSSLGVSDISLIDSLLETMEKINMPLLVHGEVTDPGVDVFDREAVFIERYLQPMLKRFSNLRVVLEHITTKNAVEFVETSGFNLAATITPHHLHINRNAMFLGGFRSDFYCLPIAKREDHRLALRDAATSGKPCFFLGTDSAPHVRSQKENACGCAGIFNAPFALESYAEVFDEEGKIDRLEAFASEYGPLFYGLPPNTNTIKLRRNEHVIPRNYSFKDHDLKPESFVPFHAGETLKWFAEAE